MTHAPAVREKNIRSATGRKKGKGLTERVRPETRIELKQSLSEPSIVAAGNCIRNRIGTENGWDQQGKLLVIEVSDPDYSSRNTELSHRANAHNISESSNEHFTPPSFRSCLAPW